MSVPSTGPRPSNRHRRRQSPVVGVILVIVGMVVLFGAGYGLSRIIQGSSGGGESASSSSATGGETSTAPEPEPCVTVTVTPGAGLPSAAQVTTNVYNATDRAGLAAGTAEQLQVRGFVIGKIDNDPLSKTITGVAEIRHGPSGESAARLMAFYLPGAELVDDGRKDATIDTVLGAAFTEVAAQSEVDTALAAPSPSPSGPGCKTPAPAATTEESASPSAS
ncbi:MAG: LytR C-terminal domain-containing protein [Actinomycetales bacterium]|nr:LytR C-terminal domain-containing protein [Actinomycetales bacterium]